MKTFKIALAMLVLLALAMPSRADVAPKSAINVYTKVVEAKKVVVQLTNLAEQPTLLTLRSTRGNVYYKGTIRKHNGHRTLLDLSQLPEGRYILSVSQKGNEKSQVIRVTEGRVLLSDVWEAAG